LLPTASEQPLPFRTAEHPAAFGDALRELAACYSKLRLVARHRQMQCLLASQQGLLAAMAEEEEQGGAGGCPTGPALRTSFAS